MFSTRKFNNAYFYFKFSSQETHDIAVKMKYAELESRLPKEVDLKITGNDGEEFSKKSIFEEKLLSTDVKKAIMELNH